MARRKKRRYGSDDLVVDLDAEGFKELYILIADFKLGLGAEGGDERGLVGSLLALLAETDRSLENQEDVVAAVLDTRNHVGDLVGIGKGFVDGLAQFLHKFFQFLIHDVTPEVLAWAATTSSLHHIRW